jgi:outer membrane lipoprotein-sorting protein
MADRLSEVLLEVTPSSRLARIVLTEVDGASTEFRFGYPKEDLGLSDGLFQFTPPPGVETIEGNLAP